MCVLGLQLSIMLTYETYAPLNRVALQRSFSNAPKAGPLENNMCALKSPSLREPIGVY